MKRRNGIKVLKCGFEKVLKKYGKCFFQLFGNPESGEFNPVCNSVRVLLLNTMCFHAVVIRCLGNCILAYFYLNSVAHLKTALYRLRNHCFRVRLQYRPVSAIQHSGRSDA